MTGSCRILQWELNPDLNTLLKDINTLIKNDQQPPWHQYTITRNDLPERSITNTMFNQRFELLSISLPETVRADQPLKVQSRWSLLRPIKHFHDYAVFLHLYDQQGERKAILGYPLWKADFDHGQRAPIELAFETPLAPGEYKVYMGLWNTRTRKRLILNTTLPDTKNNAINSGTLTVTD